MLKQLNDTINYIEEHLLDEKVIDEAMKRVSVSELHFKNVFFFLTGMSINEYVKNRRLSEANYDLLHGKKVTDIAFKYGYQSMDGFTRAFKNWCGFLPSEISKRGEHKVFPKFNFIVKVSGGNSMECRIIEKSAFIFVGCYPAPWVLQILLISVQLDEGTDSDILMYFTAECLNQYLLVLSYPGYDNSRYLPDQSLTPAIITIRCTTTFLDRAMLHQRYDNNYSSF